MNLVTKFDADFITTRADGRAECGHEIGRFAAKFEPHAADGFFRDASECAPPTRMHGRDGAFLGIDEKNGNAIGGLHGEQKPGRICDGGIALAGSAEDCEKW